MGNSAIRNRKGRSSVDFHYRHESLSRHSEPFTRRAGLSKQETECVCDNGISSESYDRRFHGALCPFLSLVPQIRECLIGEACRRFLRGSLSRLGECLAISLRLRARLNRVRSCCMSHTPKGDETLFETLEPLNRDVAGIDIGSETHYVSVAEDRDEQPVRTFGCFTPDLQAMASWLSACRITSVVMESTGVYWLPAYQVLSEAGFEVVLVDAHHARHVPGRKTDVWDCCWLRKLHTFGLLRGCFIPPQEVGVLRTYWRHRGSLVEGCAQQIHRMQKALEQMNLQLHKTLTDITGVSGMRILRAIVAGERNPKTLARLSHPSVKASEEEIVKALSGHWRAEHLFTLRQALATYDFLHQQIKECDQQIQQVMAQFEDKTPPGEEPKEPPAPNRASRRKNQPHFDLRQELVRITGVDLTRIDGIDALTAQTLIAEVGPNLSAFATEKHFASWLGLCPNHRITGGKVKSRRTKKVQNRTAQALRIAAQSLHRSKSALGAYYRRMRARLGPAKAVTATAHKLARLIYRMLTQGQAYVDQGQDYYEQKYQQQVLQSLHKKAAALGYTLVQNST